MLYYMVCCILWMLFLAGGRGGVRLEVEASGEKVPRWNIQEFGFEISSEFV